MEKYLNDVLTTKKTKTPLETRKQFLGKMSTLLKEYNIEIEPIVVKKTINKVQSKKTVGYKFTIDDHYKNLALGYSSEDFEKFGLSDSDV